MSALFPPSKIKYIFFSVFLIGGVVLGIIFSTQIGNATHDFALKFDGVDDYVSLGNDSSLDLTDNFEVSFWMKIDPAAYPPDDWVCPINRIDEAGLYEVYWFICVVNDGSGKLQIGSSEGPPSSKSTDIHSTVSVVDGSWHHIVWQRISDDYKIFIDDIDRTDLARYNVDSGVGDVNAPQDIYVGGDVESNRWYFPGEIDEVQITVDGQIKGLWLFNEGGGVTVTDSSGKGNNGVVSGGLWVTGHTPEPAPGSAAFGARRNNVPKVTFDSKLSGIYRGDLSLHYTASDPDDTSFSPAEHKLLATPISVYYSDDFRPDVGRITWNKIAESLVNSGEFIFDTTTVPDGDTYKLRVVATDGRNDFGEGVSEIFAIDNTAPSFDVELLSAQPVRETDVLQFKITSSEELKTSIRMWVTQEGGELRNVKVKGGGTEFTAEYRVIRGFRGRAVVSLEGEDFVGNIGEVITSGRTFSVERFGPPAPVITTPADGASLSEAIITIEGTSEKTVEIFLTLNGVETFTTIPTSDGSFVFENIILSPERKGLNTLSIIAVNQAGEDSEEVVLRVKLNSPPEIIFVTQFGEVALFGDHELVWDTRDPNDDPLTFRVEFSNDGGVTWGVLADELVENFFLLATLYLADGNYRIRVIADDGTSQVSDELTFSVQNNMPSISLDIPLPYITQNTTPPLRGTVTSTRRDVIGMRYSFDQGETWQGVVALDGNFNSLNEKFEIPLAEPLVDGHHTILIGAEWREDRFVHHIYSFTVDNTPPKDPILTFPAPRSVVDPSIDSNPGTEGIQMSFTGIIDADTRATLVVNDETYRRITIGGNGQFTAPAVTLVDHGINEFTLTSIDRAGNISELSGIIISDNPPEVSLATPVPGVYWRGAREVSWRSSDIDGDPLLYDLSYRTEGAQWRTIVEDIADLTYTWNLSQLSSEAYQLRVVADDSFTTSESVVDLFIDNVRSQGAFQILGEAITNDPRPRFSGNASDDFSGVEFVEYSLDNVVWYRALITDGFQERTARFTFTHRFALADGEYDIGVRITDRSGNIRYLDPQALRVETTPPRVGSYTLSSGAIVLFPEGEFFRVPVDTQLDFTISLEDDTRVASLTLGSRTIELVKNNATALWEADISFNERGVFGMLISAEDFASNTTLDRAIGSVEIKERGGHVEAASGEFLEGTEIETLVFSEADQSWRRWQSEAYDLTNPVFTDERGEYELLLPEGTYQLVLEKEGYQKVRSSSFDIVNPRFITFDFVMNVREGVRGFFEDILESFDIF